MFAQASVPGQRHQQIGSCGLEFVEAAERTPTHDQLNNWFGTRVLFPVLGSHLRDLSTDHRTFITESARFISARARGPCQGAKARA